jgi:hypothetical protein
MDPGSINPCILYKEDVRKFYKSPLLNNDKFMKGFIIKLVTGISCELHQDKNKLKNVTACINQLLHASAAQDALDEPSHRDTPDFA